jgi:hypothetical protein
VVQQKLTSCHHDIVVAARSLLISTSIRDINFQYDFIEVIS